MNKYIATGIIITTIGIGSYLAINYHNKIISEEQEKTRKWKKLYTQKNSANILEPNKQIIINGDKRTVKICGISGCSKMRLEDFVSKMK